jgi:hypothetical protein
MHISIRSVVAGLLLMQSLAPLTAAAQSAEPSPSSSMIIEQSRSALVGAGFLLEPTLTWDWTSPPVSTFRAHDVARGRIALVLIYPSADAAALARAHGTTPVDGYGPSSWNGNVAVVQTSQAELDRIARIQTDCDNGVLSPDQDLLREPDSPTLAVDFDLLQALFSGAANL